MARGLPKNANDPNVTQKKKLMATTTLRSDVDKENEDLNVEEAEEKAHREAMAAERRALRAKKAQQKKDREQGVERSDDELEERPDTLFTSRAVVAKTSTVKALASRSGRIPVATVSQPLSDQDDASVAGDIDEDEDDLVEIRGRSRQRGSMRIRSPSHSPSHSLSCSQSPAIGDKRARSAMDLNSSDVEALTAQKKTKNSHTGRPKAADYDDVAKELILLATTAYRALISTTNAFPDSATEIKFIAKAWKRAAEDAGLPPMVLTPDISKIIKARGSQTRGDMKSKTKTLVETLYGFNSGHGRITIANNRTKAEDLKHQKGYVYKTLTDDGKGMPVRKGLYQHPIIQKAVNAMWFKNCRDVGIKYEDMFNPLPIPAIAFALTAIECNIDEWVTGIQTDVIFWAEDYRAVFQGHIDSLTTFGETTSTHDLLGRLQRHLYNYGRAHAGAPPASTANAPAIPISAFKEALKEWEENSVTDTDGEDAVA